MKEYSINDKPDFLELAHEKWPHESNSACYRISQSMQQIWDDYHLKALERITELEREREKERFEATVDITELKQRIKDLERKSIEIICDKASDFRYNTMESKCQHVFDTQDENGFTICSMCGESYE